MAAGRKATIVRILKPIAAGVAIAYFVTAFVDKPAPVHFQPENPYASKQEEILEPQAEVVMQKNIMKLGSPLSVQPKEAVGPEVVEAEDASLGVAEIVEEALESANATSVSGPVKSDEVAGNGTSGVLPVEEPPAP